MASLRHMPQLDGLRGVAIFGVFLTHFLQLPVSNSFFLPYGSMGVRLFFVLSGFLITGVLIKARHRVDRNEQSTAFTLRAFYIRRCLRLFVVFYLWLIATQLMFGGNRFWWDCFYMSNFYDILMQSGRGNHYWSLAVEEQFYLVWPVLILFLSPKYWAWLFASCIGIAVLLRFGLALNGTEYLIIKKLPFTCMDCLAAGAAVAWLTYKEDPWNRQSQMRAAVIASLVGFCLFSIAIWNLKSHGEKGLIYTATLHTGLAALFTGLLIPAIEGYRGTWGKLLALRPLCWLGKISYGCYLYHLVIRECVDKICDTYGIELPLVINFFAKTALTVLVAYLSWIFVEDRVNQLKVYFPMYEQKVVLK